MAAISCGTGRQWDCPLPGWRPNGVRTPVDFADQGDTLGLLVGFSITESSGPHRDKDVTSGLREPE